jgi:hypothetical protein
VCCKYTYGNVQFFIFRAGVAKSYHRVLSGILHLQPISRSSSDTAVSVLNKLRTGQPGSPGYIPGRGKTLFSSPERPDRFWSPPRYGTGAASTFLMKVNRPKGAADHPPVSSVQLRTHPTPWQTVYES